MPIDRNLGTTCKYTADCKFYQGIGIPDNMKRSIWRNVYCYRGSKGWRNCLQYKEFENQYLKNDRNENRISGRN